MLYIKDRNFSSNVAENGFATISGYIHCCKILHDSLKKFGQRLIVLTNEPDIIIGQEPDLIVQNVRFELTIPRDIKFFSAHHKIDIFKYLSLNGDAYSILLDNDVICINNIPENMNKIIKEKIPMYYDITDQCYPAYGREKIIRDKTLIAGFESLGSWAGGEFIGGDKEFFNRIYEYCIIYWDTYSTNFTSLHHQGDEMLVSCAIEKYFLSGNPLFNAASIGGIGRYWSVKTLHIGKPFDALVDNFLLHLPADKEYLSKYNERGNFVINYKNYLKLKEKRKKVIEKIKRYVKKIIYKQKGGGK
jgi:hypothetical protein